MDVNMSPEIETRVKDELAAGRYRDVNQFVETAVQYFLDQRERSQRRLQALRRSVRPSTLPVCMSAYSFPARNERRPGGRL